MERINGEKGAAIVERVSKNEYLVRWDIQEEEEGASWYEKKFPYKPSLELVKEVILGIENKMVDAKILSGYVWKDMQIWLSTENQLNYKAAYDIAVQTSGASLPVKYKFGTTEDPVYYTFEDLQDFSDFYMGAISYMSGCLNEGWTRKDSINWDSYKVALDGLLSDE